MEQSELSPEMRRLIVAARVVAFSDQGPSAIKELDEASEAFADKVPWDNEPVNAKGWCTLCGCGNDTHGFGHLKSCPSTVSE